MMRKLIVMAMVAGLVGVGGYVRNASAGATIDLVFVSKNGGAIAATDTVTAAPGDTLVMNIVMRNDVGLSGHAFSIQYDLSGTPANHELDVVGRLNWLGISMNKTNTQYGPLGGPPGGFSTTTPTFVGSWQSTNGASSNLLLLPSAGAFAGGYTIGTVGWKVSGGVATDGQDILAGYFNPGVDGLGGANFGDIAGTALFHGATVNVVPEPGTAALLGFGLVGLVLAGRRNRA